MEQIQSGRAGAPELTRDRSVRVPAPPGALAVRQRLQQGVTVESLLYLGIVVAAALTRFWDLGSRALHHDETLHSYYSWLYAEGYGYQHNPLMHGPFLFHANALMFLLFGATDYVTRIVPAIAGVMIVMLPWLLRGRNLLGRWGALAASALLLTSPTILYYSRFIRHDIYAALGSGILFVAIVRYLERPERRWVVVSGLTLAFMFTNHEVSFIVVFIFAIFLGAAVAVRVAPALLVVALAAVASLGVVDKLLGVLGVGPLPGIPWENPTGQQIGHFAVALLVHPLVVATIAIGLLTLAATLRILDRQRRGAPWLEGLLGDAPPGSTVAALRWLLADPFGLLLAAGIGVLIFVALYTSLFSNMIGLASGTFGSLGYWLGQQGVQRGEQPWFYYLLLLPQYEFVAVVIFPFAAVWTGWGWLRAWRERTDLTRRVFVRGFLLFWSLLMLAVLSWAGEKMPWLTVHLTLPMVLLAASVIGEAIERLECGWAGWSSDRRREILGIGAGVVGIGAAAFLVMGWATAGPYVQAGQTLVRTVRPVAAAHWWLVYLPWLALVVLLGIAVRRLDARRTLAVLGIAGTLALGLAQVHAAWRMTYTDGDVPQDMLIYVQTSPEVVRVTNELTQLSQETTGGMGLSVWYDAATQWPFNWYLRDFPNRRYFGTQLTSPPDAAVVLVSQDYLTPQMEQQLSNYTYQQYPMRWWFPEEETYRRFAYAPDLKNPGRQNYQDSRQPPFSVLDVAGSVWQSIWAMHQPQEQGKIFRLVAYRELPAPIGVYWFRVYVRNDLVAQLNGIRY